MNTTMFYPPESAFGPQRHPGPQRRPTPRYSTPIVYAQTEYVEYYIPTVNVNQQLLRRN